jgi:NAD(P)-dependent dehydrogenase (short-subunit alcohol dehydrogenase family)
MRELVVVTGTSTGIGAAAAREFARRGFHVLAGVRRPQDADAIRATHVEPVILDITDADHIRSLSSRVAQDPGKLRALVNNAGIQVNVPIEAFPIDRWRRLFEVNLFGHVALTQALIPALIDANGRVINISSVGGRVAMAAYGPYAATKFALEATSDALRRELASSGVAVVVIEPGAVQTEMLDRATAAADDVLGAMTLEQGRRYGRLVQAVNAQAVSSTRAGLPAEAAARVIAKAVTARRPRTRYGVGRDAALITRMARVLPDRALDRVIAATLRPHFPAATG